MDVMLYINNHLIELGETPVVQTKQVNDLGSLENRQTNFTNVFNVPKTPGNSMAFGYISMPGNKSDVPYKKNEAYYYEGDACLIYKGWAHVSETSQSYRVHIYDGNLDLYKAMENKTLSDLDLTELNHAKTLQKVKESWNGQTPYRYILADYNGNTSYGNPPVINIDYLVPSVKVEYLWNKIFSTYEFSYSGAVFHTQEFKNLWMTYPKGIRTSDSETTAFESSDYSFQSPGGQLRSYFAKFNSFSTFNLLSATNQIHLKAGEAGTYRLKVSGSLNSSDFLGQNKKSRIFIGKNADAMLPQNVQSFRLLQDNIERNEDFSAQAVFQLEQYESICIIVAKASTEPASNGFLLNNGLLSAELVKINAGQYDFQEAFIDFSLRDFFREIVLRFGLTPFKDKYANHYRFLTLAEQLQNAGAIDWSDKFLSVISEKYVYSSYAQKNNLKYAYNEKEDNYNDGKIEIENANLPETKDVIKSRIYSPEKNKRSFFGHQVNVFRLWDKEIVTTGTVEETEYKSLDRRFYFLRSENKAFAPSIRIGSQDMEVQQTVGNAPVASFWKLDFESIVQDYYTPLQRILNRAKVLSVKMKLNTTEVAEFDFRQLYYISQFSGYFIVNKINGYQAGKPVIVELVHVQYTT